ncbi:ArsR/SmtB family transcription factor [Streptomyces radicis]|uniref:ArsR family transcriptional regulator n=1 Tax=Streptomyces radicis TaxID=1750517 RepID=A0A3A9VV29_9ACTN|nr:winged helix-turn-helix transcriptional regulator [Streptomyces radicis]RKN04855.1 ArsR family transcriptional regulator [Streptomyces radicis]RKN25365.1 ArsR family transcriptional regulator [Streptomyces radicis]
MSESAPSRDVLAWQVAELTRRVSELETRLGGERTAGAEAESPDGYPDTYWALPHLRERLEEAEHGGVLFAGSVVVPSGQRVEWERSAATDAVLGTDWSELAETLGALGQPVRLRLMQALLEGRSAVAELTELDGLGTTGQIYHHLRQLVATGWLETTSRGRYQVPPTRLVPLLIMITAARR